MTTDDPLLGLEFGGGIALPDTHAEESLLKHIRGGPPACISLDLDVQNAHAWSNWDTIRADFLLHILHNPERYQPDNRSDLAIHITGANISGLLNCEKLQYPRPLQFEKCRFEFAPCLTHSQIGPLSFFECFLPGFMADSSVVDGSLLFSDSIISDALTLTDIEVTENLDCGAQFNGEFFCSFSAKRIDVKRNFSWHTRLPSPKGLVQLEQSRVGELSIDPLSWPQSGNLDINGFTYDRIDRSLSVTDHIKWIKLMANERAGKPFFHHQPWEQARKVYRDEGDADAVRQINMAYDAAKARFAFETAHGVLKPFVGLRNVLYDKLAGHGHNLFRVVPWMALCMAVFFAWASFAYHHGSIVPTASRIYMNTCYLDLNDTNCQGWELHPRSVYVGGAPQPLIDTPPLRVPEGYPAFHAFLYTLDTFIPFADLHQEAYWTVTDDGPWGEWMRAIFSVFIGLGGVLSAIFAAGMFSLIRKN